MIKCKVNKMYFFVFIGITFLSIFLYQGHKAFAAALPVTVNTVDYDDENLIINNNQNTKIFFAGEDDAAKGNWEIMEADRNPDGTLASTTTIDLSWLSSSVESILKVKGEDGTQVRVIILPRTQKFEVSISYANLPRLTKTDTISTLLNIMTTAGTAQNPITFDDLEWKKGEGGRWKDIHSLTVGQLEKYQIKGTYLYFRIKAVNDVTNGAVLPDGTKGRRASNTVKLKIARKAPAMVVGIDGEEFTAAIKYGKEYRVTMNGVTSDWIQVIDKTVKTIPLADIANDGTDGTIPSKAFDPMFLEIRDYSTSKTASSKITEISLDAQRILSGSILEEEVPEGTTSADDNIYVNYNGIKNLNVTIPAASSDNPYEYCIVKPGDTFDINRVVWYEITKNTVVKILSSKAVEGGTLYIRQKEIEYQKATSTTPAVAYAIASTYVSMPINYPSIPSVEKTSFVFTKGYSDSLTFTVNLNVLGKKPFETKIKNIKLGTREIGYTYTVTPAITDPVDTTKLYTMTITLDKASLVTMTNCYGRAITVNFENGTADKTSVKLTIQNATPAYTLTATPTKGSAAGTTAVTIASALGVGNSWVYTITDTEVKNQTTFDTITTGTPFTPGADITVAENKYLTVYEINTTKNIVKYKSILISKDFIG